MKDQRHTRREYVSAPLRRASLAADPLVQFQQWFSDALEADAEDVTAMALATASSDAVPSVRIVLLKHFDEQGFCWYTDYRSQKGSDLADNPRAACLFHWRELHRQVRIEGSVVKVDAADASAYFASRPEDSRFSAAASQQSAPVDRRETLEARVAELRSRYADGAVPKPADWGGYCLRPEVYEFWQGREGRLHDRFRFSRSDEGWNVERLQP
ncbi:MAG: pyridoxamine 5'-phosphate oxidase [Pseudomonadales bacterium]